jgi:hypothetical protein
MASGLTPNFDIPFPLSTDPVDVSGDVQDLAERIDTLLDGYAILNVSNTFTQPNIFSVNSTSTAVRITQTGTGDVLRVEDAANPDSTPFIVNNAGNVGIGLTSPLEILHVVGNENLSGLLFVGADARTQYQSVGTNVKTASFKEFNATTDVAKITTTVAHGFFPGQTVVVLLTPSDAQFDGQVDIIDVPTTTTFTYTKAGAVNVSSTATAGSASAVPGFTNPIAIFTANAADYAQLVVQNINNSSNSSSDVIVYANNGNDSNGWIDMGITSSTFTDPEFTITGPNDGYIFMSAPYGTTGSGNLVLATDGTGTENKIVFAAGGLSTDNTQMEITPDVNIHIEIPTPSTSPSTGALTVVGGIGVQGDMFIAGDLDVSSGGIIANDTLFVGADAVSQSETIGTNVKTASFKARATTVATITTTAPHGYQPFQFVDVALSPADAVFDGTNKEILTVPTSTTFTYAVASGTTSSTATAGTISAVPGWTNPVAIFTADNPDYSQIVFQNLNSGTAASTDFIAYSDNGTDYSGWIDVGITSSTFSDPEFTITGPNDGYVFMRAPYGTSGAGNLVLATSEYGTENKIIFAAGGLDSDDTQMEITPGVNVHIEIPTPSVSPTTGALTIVGGVGVQGDMNIQGDINIVGDLTFGGGSTTTETLGVTDPAIFVGVNNDADSVDLGLYIEYAPSLTAIVKSVDQKSLTSNVATLRTTTTHGFLAGDVVTITGVDATFNGTNINIIDVPTTTTFTYAKTAADVSSTAVSPVGTATVNNRRKYGGIVRDASDGVFKFFTGATTTPTTSVNFSEAGVVFGDLKLNSVDLNVALTSADGGTGFSTYATGDLLYASATNTISKLSAGTNGHLLTLSSGVPVWAAAPVSLPSQTGNAGELLTTDGTSATWGNTVTANAIGSIGLIAKGLSGQTADIFQVQNNGGTSLVGVDSAGNLSIVSTGGVGQKRGLSLTSGTPGTGGIYILSGSTASGDGATVEAVGRRSDGNGSRSFAGTVALAKLRTDAATATGAVLGSVVFGANPSSTAESNVIYSAAITAESNGAWSSSSAMPTDLVFMTGSTGTALITANANVGTERMRILSGGNVGIGASAPASKLEVNGTFRSIGGALIYGQNSANLTTNNGLTLGTVAKASAPSGGQGLISINSSDATNQLQGTISLVTDPTAGNRRLSIGAIEQNVAYRNVTLVEGGGLVGIGTATPTGTLDIYSSSLASLGMQTGAYSRYWLSANSASNSFSIGGNGSSAPASGAINIDSSGNSSFAANASFAGRITSTLANNTATGSGQIYLNGATGNRIDFNTNGVAAPTVGTRSAGTKLVLYPSLAGSAADFAIGIESATLWQSVADSAQQFKWYAATTNIATLSGGGNFTVSGNVTAYSDERLKSNIKTIENALEKVSKLRGVSFDKNGEKGIGVIAQEVQEVLPEVVQDGEYLSVAYGNIVGLLIEAIKEQQEQIEDLKKRLA